MDVARGIPVGLLPRRKLLVVHENGTDGKFLAWKQGDEKWYSFDEASQAWVVLPGQEDVEEDQQVPAENKAGDTFTIPGLFLESRMIAYRPGLDSRVINQRIGNSPVAKQLPQYAKNAWGY